MIHANELRLGNIVSRRREPGVVISLDQEDLWVQFGGEWGDKERWYYDDIEGVDLTPEILEKCGLVRYVRAEDYITADDNHPLDFVDISGNLDGWEIFDDSSFFIGKYADEYWPIRIGAHYDESTGPHKIGKPLKHVHHLQNLYFVLTGEELEVKL